MRRVPGRFRPFDERQFVRTSLKTESIEVARFRRDALEAADDDFWASMLIIEDGETGARNEVRLRDTLAKRYRSASARAIARGFTYAPVEQLVQTAELGELLDRINVVKQTASHSASAAQEAEAAAMLGAVEMPSVTVSEAFDTYRDEIVAVELISKSAHQKALWEKTKRRAVTYFVKIVGDKPMHEITRDDARKYYNWWAERLLPMPGKTPLKSNTANRDLGNMRQLYSAYFKHIGEEERPNPFRNLSFKDTRKAEVKAFDDAWVQEKFLVPGAFDGLNAQAVAIIYALIETGCRPSEIANLMPDDICLGENVPFIRIRPSSEREIKTQYSIRDIPLVGVSLEAMRTAPNGFPHYRDKNDLLSQSLMKAFKVRGLLPSKNHRIYSFRHAFEKRMLEADLDYGFRCMIMGHRNTRPVYGDGGSMAYRQQQLLKIAHPVACKLF